MSQEQAALMLRLQQLGFTMDDLRIYLDVHLCDSFAIERYNTTAREYQNLLTQYANTYGPLTYHSTNLSPSDWLWAEQAFPWDY